MSSAFDKPYPTQSPGPLLAPSPFGESPMAEMDYSLFDIVKATQYGILSRVQHLIEKEGVDPKYTDDENITALHWASINNRIDIAE
jgi:ankyrin repeat protein